MADKTQAFEHIRLMQQRITEQIEKIEQLERSGKDAMEGRHRLQLLERALEEMRIQIGHLSPTRMDEKRDRMKG
ncbi:hypothetical protein [Dongia deserti]|uniref:hypothetical protein n=1 Tax=Dongia deserti TaxID=2268030 RepID=UPI000E650D4D|nr:hypothetical protein [Dongia deserti]